MNKPVSRRLFMRAAPAASVAIASLTAEVAEARALSAVGISQFVNPGIVQTYGIGAIANSPALLALHAVNALPDWLMKDIEQDTARQSYALQPDVACLKSVSVGSKWRIHRERSIRSTLSELSATIARDVARRKFFGTG